MERLTKYIEPLGWQLEADISVLGDCKAYNKAISKLAEYEDTGLPPDDVIDILAVISESQDDQDENGISTGMLHDLLELYQYRKTGLSPKEVEETRIWRDYWRRTAFEQTRRRLEDSK